MPFIKPKNIWVMRGEVLDKSIRCFVPTHRYFIVTMSTLPSTYIHGENFEEDRLLSCFRLYIMIEIV